MRLIVTLLLLVFHFVTFSQKSAGDFGKISMEEMLMANYEKDENAKAVVLFDIGESKFVDVADGYEIRFTKTKRIKIFDREASSYAEVSIPYYVDKNGRAEEVNSIEAFTYNQQGGQISKISLDNSTIYDEQINDRWRVKKFVFPGLKDASVLEFKYVLQTPFFFNLPDWTFQDKIPTIYSEYTARMIPFYEYVYFAQGVTKFDYQNAEVAKQKRTWGTVLDRTNVGGGVEFQDFVYTFVLKDVPAFYDQSFITSDNDYIIKIDFQLAKFHRPNGTSEDIITTWPDLSKSLLKHEDFGRYIKASERLAKKVVETGLDLTSKNNEQKYESIMNYVKSNFSWNGHYTKYATKAAKDFMTQKNGSSADINLFLVALFNEAGLDAGPVIISTRDHGKIKLDYPFEHFFNNVIVLVKVDKPFLADGTESYISFNRIPPNCINEKGLLVNEKETSWVELGNNLSSLSSNQLLVDINPTNLIAVSEVKIQANEYESYNYKKSFRNDSTLINKYFLNQGFKKITRLSTLNFQNSKLPYVMSFIGESEIDRIGNNIIISPFLGLAIRENVFKQRTRSFPIDFIYAKEERFDIKVNIPDGFEILTLPDNFSMDNDLAEISTQYQVKNGIINIQATYFFKKPIYGSADYPRIKGYMDYIVKLTNEQVVLREITN